MAQLKDLLVTGPSRFIGDVFANNLQAFRITDDLVPIEDNTYSLGTSTLRWKEMHAVSFKGEADKAKQLSNNHTFKVSDNDKTNTGSSVIFNGTQDVELLLPANIKFSNILATSNITVNTGDIDIVNVLETNKFLGFYYNANKTAGASWRIGHIGSGSGDTNYFVIQSGTSPTSSTTWNDVVRLGMDSFDAWFKANVNPQVTDTQSLGTSSLKWNAIYATHLYGEADKAKQLSTGHTFVIKDNYEAYAGSSVLFNGTQDVVLKLNKDVKFDNIRTVTTIRPETTNTGTLGTGSYFWKGAYISGRDNGYGIHWNNLFNKNSLTGSPILTTEYMSGLPRLFGYGTATRPSNLFYGVKASSTTVEFTTNGGSSWTEKSINVENLFTGATMTATPGLNTAGTGFDAYDATSTSSTTGGGSGTVYAANFWKNKGIRITFTTAEESRSGWVDCIVLHFGTASTGGGETISSASNASHYIIERQQYDGTWTTIAQSASTNWNSNDRTQIIYPQPSFYLQYNSTTNNASYAKAIRITFIVDSWGTAYRYAPRLISFVGYGSAGGLSGGATYTGSEFARFMTSFNAPYLIEDYRTGTLGLDSDLLPRKRVTEGSAVVTNNIHNIGGSSRRWAGIYAQNADFAGNLNVTGNTTISGKATINNILTLYRTGTIAQHLPAGIEFSNKDSDGQAGTMGYIYYYNDHDDYNYGGHMTLGAYSSLFMGAGEGPLAVTQKLIKETATSAENVYVLADGHIYLEANTQNDGTATTNNRIGFQIDTSGNLVPVKAEVANNNAQSIGTSSNKLASIYATNFYGNITGSVTGNASSATQVYSTVNVPPTGYIEFQSNQTTGSGNVGLKHHNSLRVESNASTTATTLAQTNLIVGNAISEGTKENSRGVLTLYGPKAYETKIFSAVSTAANNLYIPGYTGDGYAVTASSTSAEGSNTNPVYIAANGRATKLTYTANRLYYSASTSSFEATNHYADTTKIAINSTSAPSYNLYVSGTFYASNTSAIGGTLTVTGATTLSSTLTTTGTSTFTGKATFNGGVLVSGLTANQAIITDANKNLISRAISDSSSAETLGTSTNFVTERDVYNSLPKINNAHTYTSSSTYYAPTGGGTAGQMLFAEGSTSTPVWDTPRIEGVQIKKGATFYYGYCETAAATVAKTVTLAGTQTFTLETGARVIIKFKESNTATNPTLNVNSKGAKNIYRYGTTAVGATAVTSWPAGAMVELVYDGTGWLMTGYSAGRVEPGASGYILVGNGTSADPTWQNILGIAHGGTGLSTFTANRIYYPSAATTLSASSHYIENDKIAINSTSAPSYNLYVSGTFYASSTSAIGGALTVTGATTLNNTLSVASTSTFTGKATFNGGIGTTLDANKVVMTDANKALTVRTLSDSTTAEALSNSNTNIVTEQDVYFGLPTINNAHNYTSSTTIYAPTEGGESGALLFAEGVTSTPTWAKARIEGVQIKGGTTPATLHYGYCETAANTAAKTVTLAGTQTFTLDTGARVIIKFKESNTASNATLNVNNSGAKNIYRYGETRVGNREATSWKAGSVVEFVYDGTGWQIAASGGGALDLQDNQSKKAFLVGYNEDDEMYYYDTDTYLETVAGLLYSKYLKSKYLRVNSDDTGTTKNAIIAGNVDVGTGESFFAGSGTEVTLTNSNETTPFTVNNEAYTFTYDTANNVWVNNNMSNTSTYARKTWTAKSNYILTFNFNHNAYSSDKFKVYLNGTEKYSYGSTTTNATGTLTLKIKTGDIVLVEFYRYTNSSTSYTHTCKFTVKYESATVSDTFTYLKDVTSFTNEDNATSYTTGAVKISGGVGIAKDVYINGKLNVKDDANLTNGTLITQNIIVGSGNDIELTGSNIGTYFTKTDDITYTWRTPGSQYSTYEIVGSGTQTVLTNSNITSYFSGGTQTNTTYPWEYDTTNARWWPKDTQGVHSAISNGTQVTWTATVASAIEFDITLNTEGPNWDYFRLYKNSEIIYQNGGRDITATQLVSFAPGDQLKLYYRKDSGGEANPEKVWIVMKRYASTTNQETVHTVGDYWQNSNDLNTNTDCKTKFVAKQNCLLKISGSLNNRSGDQFYIFRNGDQVYSTLSATMDPIQVFNGDEILLQYHRGTTTTGTQTSQAHVTMKYQAGSAAKEVVLNAQTRVTNNTASTSTTTGALQVTGGLGVQGAGHFGSLNANNITGEWLKGDYLRINSDDTNTSKQAVITGNIDLGTGATIFTGNGTQTTLTSSNEATPFTAVNDTYTFNFDSTNNVWINNNTSSSQTSTTARKTWTAKSNYIITFNYNYNSQYGYFRIKQNGTEKVSYRSSTTNYNGTYTMNVKTGDVIIVEYQRESYSSTSYAFQVKVEVIYQAATTSDSYTVLKDDVSITKDTQSTSTTTGVLKVSGGVGIAKNINIGGNANITGTLTNTGNTSFTGGVFLTQNIVVGSGTETVLNDSNLSTYFTVVNDTIHPWMAPSATYTETNWTPSGSEINITSSNATTYFTITNPQTAPNSSAVAWTWNSTEGAYQAGRSDAVTTYYYIDFKAKQNCLIKFQYKKHAYSSDQFYIYYIPNGSSLSGNGTQLAYNTSSATQTTYSAIGSTYRLNTNDTIRLYFRRYTNTTTTYEHMVYVKPIYQAIVGGTTSVTNGAYWMNGNFDDTAINTTSSLKLTAKQNCMLSLDGTGSNTSGDTFTVLKNNTSIGTSTTLNNIQVFNGDIIELRYQRGSYTYNTAPSYPHEAHIVLKYKSGSVSKEAVINNNLRMPNLAAADGVVFTDDSKNLVSKVVRVNGMPLIKGIVTGFGVCSTAATTAEKVVTLQNSEEFHLETGARVFVKFSNSNTVANATLNVNNTGAKNIFDYGSVRPDIMKSWRPAEIVEFVYDGTNWMRIGASTDPFWRLPYAVCSTGASTQAKTVTITNFALETGAHIFVKFQYNNTIANPTLNVNQTGAKTIYRYGTIAPGTVSELSWQPNAVVELIYDGNYWQMVNGNGGGITPGESGYILTGNGTSAAPVWTNILPVGHGGTGLSSLTQFAIYYASTTSAFSAIAANTTATKKFLRMTGTGSAGAAPAWDTLVAADIPVLDASKVTTGTFGVDRIPAHSTDKLTSGTLGIARGGTGISSFTPNRIYYPSASTTLTASSHYIANDRIAINSTSSPSYNLYVNGTFNATTLILPTASSTTVGAIWIA